MLDPVIQETIPCLADKFVIEICNSLNVSQDHIQTQQIQQTRLWRLWGAWTGESHRRQTQVNQNLNTGLDATLQWLQTLTQEVSVGFEAIKTANQAIIDVSEGLAQLADYSIETRHKLDQLTQELRYQCDHFNHRLHNLEAEARAERQIHLLFERWSVGELNHLPIALRQYVVLERLYWGDFGDYYRQYQNHAKSACTDLLSMIRIRSTKQLKQDADLQQFNFACLHYWFGKNSAAYDATPIDEALQFMADWSDPNRHPVAHMSAYRPKIPSLHLPRILTPERLAFRSIQEFFDGRIT
jgi:hypothetical protein